ncbi:hypothetical protein [Prauserella sp. PE36]|uniref:hypothetical protein n=1 Tax=Prauserella sp. PE36 TaxID=1504709 RepID=UPI001F173088|nr:hypothetical protein [Prauserella sp. PE36]
MSERRTAQTTVTDAAVTPLLRRDRHRGHRLAPVDPAYAGLRDRALAQTLTAEDAAEPNGLDPLERLTCRTHRRWVHECIASPQHVFVVTGHRWCRDCSTAANVAVDQLTWHVSVSCPRCGRSPEGAATRQIVRTCRASMAAAAQGRIEADADAA